MKTLDLKKKSKAELAKIIKQSKDKVNQLKFDLARGKLKNVSEVRKTKKVIARALTYLKETK